MLAIYKKIFVYDNEKYPIMRIVLLFRMALFTFNSFYKKNFNETIKMCTGTINSLANPRIHLPDPFDELFVASKPHPCASYGVV